MPSEVIRVAAKGDGLTEDGQHVAGAAPGDVIEGGTIIKRGPHHVDPACQHFAHCGGCQLQHCDSETLESFVRDRVVNAAKGQALAIGELLPVHLSPPHTRRRANLHGMRTQKSAVLGYREAGSHRIVDLAQCPVLDPALVALVGPLRDFIAKFAGKRAVDIGLTLTDHGADCTITNIELEGLAPTEAALDLARDLKLARLSIDQGYGPETVWEPEPVSVTLGTQPVPFPAGAFLQATPDAETRLVSDARDWIGEGGPIADLFTGLGTFAFALAKGRKVLAVEADQKAHLACKQAAARTGGAVLTLHRDLFRNPLTAEEISRFAGVVLDPPRAGARQQVEQIAASSIARIIYVSCNPSSWARDAATLSEAGFNLSKLRPVGQFRWSNHVELVSLFER